MILTAAPGDDAKGLVDRMTSRNQEIHKPTHLLGRGSFDAAYSRLSKLK
jgi:hypothetical protein